MAKEFVDRNGAPLFAKQVEVSFRLNGWTHTSLLRRKAANDEVAIATALAAYTEGKKVRPQQVEMFERSIRNGITPFIKWDVSQGAWSFGDKSLKPRVLGAELVKRATAWWQAGSDKRGKIIIPAHAHNSELYWRGVTYSWTAKTAPNTGGKPTPPGSALSVARAKEEVCSILGLNPSDWRIITTMAELSAKSGMGTDEGIVWQESGGETFIYLWRSTGVIRRDRSYIVCPPDVFGNMAIMEGPLCDFVWMHFGHSEEHGYSSSGEPRQASLYNTAGEVVFSGPLYRAPEGPDRFVPPGIGGVSGLTYSTSAPTLPLSLEGVRAVDPGASVFELSGWLWAISGFSSINFRDVIGLVQASEKGYVKLSGEASIVHCAMPVANFRAFINTTGRDKDGKLIPELEKTVEALKPYNDGIFLATVQRPEAVVSQQELESIYVLEMAKEAGKMDEDLGKGVTLTSSLKRLSNLRAKSKQFTSFAKLYDEVITPEAVLSEHVALLVDRGSTSDVAVKVTKDINDTYTYSVSGLGTVTEVETQYLVAFGATLEGVTLQELESRWGVSVGWALDLRDFGSSTTITANRPMDWRAETRDGGRTLKPSDVCDYDGYPMVYAYPAVKQLLFKGLSDDGAEQLVLPLFLSPYDLLTDVK